MLSYYDDNALLNVSTPASLQAREAINFSVRFVVLTWNTTGQIDTISYCEHKDWRFVNMYLYVVFSLPSHITTLLSSLG